MSLAFCSKPMGLLPNAMCRSWAIFNCSLTTAGYPEPSKPVLRLARGWIATECATLADGAERHALAAIAGALLVALVLSSGPALAQSREEILPPAFPPSKSRGARPVSPPDLLRPTLDGRVRTDPADAILRPAQKDGDVSQSPEPVVRDGIIDMNDVAPPGPEGIDTGETDARSPNDHAPFVWPPAGHDPQPFQVEDLEPRADRRIARFFRFEPYEPVGVRVGSFVLFPQFELAGIGYSNVIRSPRARSDAALEIQPELRLVSNWRWHALELKANGKYNFHEELPSEDERGSLLEARGRLDIARRTNVQGLVSRQVSQESRSGIDANRAGDRADITTTQAQASINHRFNRLSLQLRGGVTDTEYEATRDDSGTAPGRRDRDLVQTDEGVRVRYDLKSSIGLFADATLVQRAYQAAAPDGLKCDSDGERYRTGLAFLPNHPRLRGEVSLGWGVQRPDERQLTTVDGLLIDANLVWRMTPLTSFLLTVRSEIGDSVTEAVSGVITRSVGVEARQALRKYLTASIGLHVTRTDYRGIELDEKETAARLALEYAISREILLFSRYEHVWFNTSEVDGNWQADEIRLGVRIRQ